ncbi:MAG: hypothetical protein JXR68_05200 [Bacteroidales bacterium]|nr:hypothetical protein [Bacteroidales bacterium]
MSKFGKILNLQKGEEKAVIYLLIYSFFIGVALAFYVTTTTSLFLSAFERDFLPISFIAAGVIVWITGKLMSMLFNKINLSKSIPVGLVFLLLSLLVFLLLYKINTWLFVIFLLYAWIRVFAYMHAVIFWSLAGRLFMLRQAKRVFSLITGGEVFASILSFFSIPFLLTIFQTSDLLLISGVFLTLGFFFMLIIVKKFNSKLLTKGKTKDNQKSAEIKLFSSKYFKLIFWIAFVPIFAQFFVDFIFQAQAKVEFPDREELSAFLGIFLGVSAIIEFSLKTFISGRLLSKYGIKLGLLAFPVVLGISFLLASIFGLIFGTIGMFFSLVAMGRLFTRAVRTSFNDPSTQILYQPIPIEQRILIQNKIESGPKAYASIVAGIFLLLFSQIPNISLVVFSIMLFAVIVFWIKLSIDVYYEYKNRIQDFLGSNSTQTDKKLPDTKEYFKLVFSKGYGIISANIKKIFFPYDIEQNKTENTILKLSEIAQKANSFNKKERIIAAENLSNYSIYRVEKLYLKLLRDECFEVRNQAIISAGKTKEKDLYDKIIDNFKILNYRKSATNAIINIGPTIIPKLMKTFYSNENNMDLQLEIIDVISNIQSNKSVEFLRKLINYPIKPIMDKSISGLAHLGYEMTKTEKITISEVLEHEINRFVYIIASLVDLKNLPDNDELILNLQKIVDKKNEHIFDILSVLYNKKAIDLIRNNLANGNEETKGFAIEIADTVFSELHKEILLPVLEGLSNLEILRRYKHYYPQENLDVYNRIIDLIDAEIQTTGIFVKVEAIKKLTDYNTDKTVSTLKASIVSPIDIISETAAFTLFLLNEQEFENRLSVLKNKNKNVLKLYNKIKQENSSTKLLIFEKKQLLSSLNGFNNLTSSELYLLAKKSKEIIIVQDKFINSELIVKTNVIILISGMLKFGNNLVLEAGSVISNLFINYKKTDFLAEETTMLFVVPVHVFNTLFSQNKNFTEHVFSNVLAQI